MPGRKTFQIHPLMVPLSVELMPLVCPIHIMPMLRIKCSWQFEISIKRVFLWSKTSLQIACSVLKGCKWIGIPIILAPSWHWSSEMPLPLTQEEGGNLEISYCPNLPVICPFSPTNLNECHHKMEKQYLSVQKLVLWAFVNSANDHQGWILDFGKGGWPQWTDLGMSKI